MKETSKTNRLLTGISVFGQKLKVISKHPAISVTSLDVLFTTITLLTWTFTRDLDVGSILESSVLSFMAPNHEKHVAFKQDLARLMEHSPESPAPIETIVESTTPRKRGRPRKAASVEPVNGAAATSSATTGSLRRSTRTKAHKDDIDSDADSTYQPSEQTRQAVEETEADGAIIDGDLVHAGESTALALFLTFAGGVGQLASGVLGAEVTGPRE